MRLLILLPLLLAACSPYSPPHYADLATYACADGTTLRVRFGKDGAHVTQPDNSVLILPQQVAASGMWYATPQYELRGQSGDATWTAAPRGPVACRVQDNPWLR